MRQESELDRAIRAAGWWDGTSEEFRRLDSGDRAQLAFVATGCAVAWCTWAPPVDCVHTKCRILRGELPRIAETNGILRAEMDSGWLRFRTGTRDGRAALAKLCRATRKAARLTGEYDPWKLCYSGIVGVGLES